MGSERRVIGVVALGEVPDLISKSIAAHIQGLFRINTDFLGSVPLPPEAFDRGRFQYNASSLLSYLERLPFGKWEKVVGVLEGDLYIPIFTHLLGEAQQGGKFALVSLHRLGRFSENPSSSLLLERSAKVALHELGHLYSLHHCTKPGCIMHFSGSLKDLDETPFDTCTYCSVFLRDALGSGPSG